MNMADWLVYANQGATRSQPLSEDLVSALSFLPEMGLQMEVFSGGQPTAGNGPRVGSTRHDHGGAADVFFSRDGQRLDWSNPADQPVFEEVVRRARANGVTGFGAGDGYMQPGSMHIGFGNPAVWGAGGKGENAPDWLRSAFQGSATAPTSGPSLSYDGSSTSRQARPHGSPELSFGNAAPTMPQSSVAAMFDPSLQMSMGMPLAGADPREDQRQRREEEQQKQEADRERRVSLADLMRY